MHTARLRQEGSLGGGFLSRDVLDGKESQTVWVFWERSDFIMKLFLREFFFFSFFFCVELALAGIECRTPVSDPPRDPLVYLRP